MIACYTGKNPNFFPENSSRSQSKISYDRQKNVKEIFDTVKFYRDSLQAANGCGFSMPQHHEALRGEERRLRNCTAYLWWWQIQGKTKSNIGEFAIRIA